MNLGVMVLYKSVTKNYHVWNEIIRQYAFESNIKKGTDYQVGHDKLLERIPLWWRHPLLSLSNIGSNTLPTTSPIAMQIPDNATSCLA